MEFAQSAPMALRRITDATGVSLILILSDINMPGMSGLDLLPNAKALRPDVPVIMITAYGDAETKRKALENGADALLTKPIDFGTLRSEIDTRVERALSVGSFARCHGISIQWVWYDTLLRCSERTEDQLPHILLERRPLHFASNLLILNPVKSFPYSQPIVFFARTADS